MAVFFLFGSSTTTREHDSSRCAIGFCQLSYFFKVRQMKNLSVDLESSQGDGEPIQRGFLRRLIYFRISLKTLIFAILKISSNKNCVYHNLHHQCLNGNM